ncbi:hypothetical protein JYU29_17105 [Tianweitania sp. BSSL-BM11]|uniref:Uncharacterized protein n=1 Tax=Tianweitania aestuarii TaxID=2814886 RepID=A0ABS5S1Q3_9HYPH|nr:hypothetical protein [Tianweitania aestuarii]MBS9722414.1 hypothetical protein [Tianweitania aestuarii]
MSEPEAASLIAEIAAKTDAAIALAQQRSAGETVDWRRRCYAVLAANLLSYKNSLLEGRLPPPGTGTGWGAGKALSEWDLDDEVMLAAVAAAEELYRDGA